MYKSYLRIDFQHQLMFVPNWISKAGASIGGEFPSKIATSSLPSFPLLLVGRDSSNVWLSSVAAASLDRFNNNLLL